MDDENKAKLVSSIRQFFYHFVMLKFLENDQDQYNFSVADAAKCSITDLGQLFPTTRLNQWNQFSTQATLRRITLLCALFKQTSFNKRQAIIKYISTAMAYLIGCQESEQMIDVWDDIAVAIGEDVSGDNKKAMAWIIRILDAFVVYAGAFDSTSAFKDQVIVQGICYGLHEVLSLMQSSPFELSASSEDIQLTDTAYRLDYYMNLHDDIKTEKEQVSPSCKIIEHRLLNSCYY